MPFNTVYFKSLKLAGYMLALLPGVCGLKAADSIAIQRQVIAEGNARWTSITSSGGLSGLSTSVSYSANGGLAINCPIGISSNSVCFNYGGFFISYDLRRTIVPCDFDGDGRTDTWYYDKNDGNWYFILSGFPDVIQLLNLGGPDALAAVEDYDGDGKADPGVYWQAQGFWQVLLSGSGYVSVMYLGLPGGVPAPGDYDGDGYADFAVMVPETQQWVVLFSKQLYAATTGYFGAVNALPASADFDGDGLTDPAVYQEKTGHWMVALSASDYTLASCVLGGPGSLPVPADYDGDLKADPMVYETANGTWHGFLSASKYQRFAFGPFGGQRGMPYIGDYDGDGISDFAVLASDLSKMDLFQSTEGFAVIPSSK